MVNIQANKYEETFITAVTGGQTPRHWDLESPKQEWTRPDFALSGGRGWVRVLMPEPDTFNVMPRVVLSFGEMTRAWVREEAARRALAAIAMTERKQK